MIDPQLAAQEHLRPGGTLHLLGIPDDAAGDPELGRAIPMAFRVAAIGVFDTEIVPANTKLRRADAAAQPAVQRHAGGSDRSPTTETKQGCGCVRARA